MSHIMLFTDETSLYWSPFYTQLSYFIEEFLKKKGKCKITHKNGYAKVFAHIT